MDSFGEITQSGLPNVQGHWNQEDHCQRKAEALPLRPLIFKCERRRGKQTRKKGQGMFQKSARLLSPQE